MLRTLRERLRLERLRQLWMQCDLFDTDPTVAPVRHEAGASLPDRNRHQPTRPRTSKRRAPRVRRDDVEVITLLTSAHAEYNAELFGGSLKTVKIRISRRMKNRLGHYMTSGDGFPAEIAISRRHIDRDVWDDVLHTFVHEMVHQWQDENGHALDHGQSFRRKAREVGISARATRPARPVPRTYPKLAARSAHRREVQEREPAEG